MCSISCTKPQKMPSIILASAFCLPTKECHPSFWHLHSVFLGTCLSSAFLGFRTQMYRCVSEIKSVVLIRSCLEPHSHSANVAPWDQCCVLASWYRGQDCRTCSGDKGLFHMDSRQCVPVSGGTGVHTVSNDQCVV